jgi:ribosomal protein S18 acetylase RimI-like enzyme
MTESIEIRRELRPGDLDAIVGLHARLYPLEYGVDSEFVEHVAKRVAAAKIAGFPGPREGAWLVDREGELAGSLVLTDEGDGVGWLRWVLIDPMLRGRGLGRQMVTESVEFARSAGFRLLHLETFSDLRAAAALYREAGFELRWTESGPRWGRDLIHYQHYELELQESSNTRRASSSASTSRSISSAVV